MKQNINQNNTRTINSIKNSITSLIENIVIIVVGFLSRTIFIKILGIEFLGLNGLFSNVLLMLSLFELGIGNAIVFSMYKPIAVKNNERIKSLILFYKKAYNIISIIVFVIGLIILPFISLIVGKIDIEINIYLIYFLFLLNTVSTYILAYKRSMLYANQKNYIINIVHTLFLVFMNVTQLVFLYYTHNYYLFLVINIIYQLFENVILSIICDKKYPYLKDNPKPIDKKTEKEIFVKVKALLFHKVGSIIVFGTDNIIISRFLGIIYVGLYANYNLIINSILSLFKQAMNAITSSVGNLVAYENKEKIFDIFKKIRFINFWISCFSAVSILIIMQPFIVTWLGNDYLLKNSVLFILVINYFQKMQRSTYTIFKDSAGIWEPDKLIPLIEAILNIVISVVLVKYIGLSGVFLGTILSGLLLWTYSYPKFVYKKIFERSYYNYFIETISYFMIFCLISCISILMSRMLVFDNLYLNLFIKMAISVVIPNIIIIIIYYKTPEFKFLLNILKNIKKRYIK